MSKIPRTCELCEGTGYMPQLGVYRDGWNATTFSLAVGWRLCAVHWREVPRDSSPFDPPIPHRLAQWTGAKLLLEDAP